jgi:hypothetical protein
MDILGRCTYMTKESNRKDLKCLGIHRVEVVVAATAVHGGRVPGTRAHRGRREDHVVEAVVEAAAFRPISTTFCARARIG